MRYVNVKTSCSWAAMMLEYSWGRSAVRTWRHGKLREFVTRRNDGTSLYQDPLIVHKAEDQTIKYEKIIKLHHDNGLLSGSIYYSHTSLFHLLYFVYLFILIIYAGGKTWSCALATLMFACWMENDRNKTTNMK